MTPEIKGLADRRPAAPAGSSWALRRPSSARETCNEGKVGLDVTAEVLPGVLYRCRHTW